MGSPSKQLDSNARRESDGCAHRGEFCPIGLQEGVRPSWTALRG